ncbi:MAG: hypothetical protein ATN36_02690 [Epulopiscium sp. Nele67-Bin005]|nr:MAG: hypothetical protein ATN36_02690 [Epulopiscium sp. Nele67-Bin005]
MNKQNIISLNKLGGADVPTLKQKARRSKRQLERCNCCGQGIEQVATSGVYIDYLHVKKEWGYFSKKDLTLHQFNICEACYDKWINSFTIPIEEVPIENVFKNIADI